MECQHACRSAQYWNNQMSASVVGSAALVGYTGFVGSNLLRQHQFDALYRSTNITDMRGAELELLVVSAIQAKKWWANQNPEADWESIQRLLDVLRDVRAQQVVLISTIDVLPMLPGLDETFVPSASNHPYGQHRLQAEEDIRALFDRVTVVRLPGLFGPGLKKNVIYDLLTGNQLEKVNPRSAFQYYDLTGLWSDIERSRQAGLGLVHLFTEPVATSVILQRFFPDLEVGRDPVPEAHYDFRTRYSGIFGGPSGYVQGQDTVLRKLELFIDGYRRGAME
jgi:hypothetical protein